MRDIGTLCYSGFITILNLIPTNLNGVLLSAGLALSIILLIVRIYKNILETKRIKKILRNKK